MLGIVLVNYKTNTETINYLKTEISKIKLPSKIAIVNNDFQASDSEQYQRDLGAIVIDVNSKTNDLDGKIFLINSGENLGFAKGNNLGAFFLINNFPIDYLLFTNNDVLIHTEDVVEQLIEKMNSLPDVALIGPKMVDMQNELASPRWDRMSASRFIFRHLFYPVNKLHVFSKLGLRTPGIREIANRSSEECYCYWVAGSFMLMNSPDFAAIKGFDPNTFLYCEEKILAERLAKIGKKVYYFGTPVIISIGGLTTSKYLPNKKRDAILFDSEIYFYKTYKGASRLTIMLLYFTKKVFFSLYYR